MLCPIMNSCYSPTLILFVVVVVFSSFPFQVDMIPGPDDDKYKFKVRSVFAENETDHLMFQWPEGKEVTSLDILCSVRNMPRH
jgi:hypothetical protein